MIVNVLIHFILSGDSIGTSSEPLLSDLREDYNFFAYLESRLENSSIKELLLELELSYEDHCKILTCATPSQAFFENLSKSRPSLSLRELRACVEDTIPTAQPNMAIFTEIEEDIAKRHVSFTLDTTLGKLFKNAKDWIYVSERIAGNLVQEESTRLISWENVASSYGYRSCEIAAFQKKNREDGQLKKLFSLLCEKSPILSVSLFVKKLKQIKREDIAKEVEIWQNEWHRD